MYLIYNSWYEEHKKPFGAIKSKTEVVFKLESDADEILLHGFNNKIKMKKDNNIFTSNILVDIAYGLIFYQFEAKYKGNSIFYGQKENSGEAIENAKAFQLTVHNNNSNPEWFNGSVMYQIYVDRFYKGESNETSIRNNVLLHSSWNEAPVYIRNTEGEIVLWDFFGGNIDGVIKKLEYINSLGVDIIYLNPIFESSSNHKYDTADYNQIDRMYGNEETLKRLIDEADKYNIKILLDGVFSHTGDDSIYFNKYNNYKIDGAYNSMTSKYSSWYNFEEFPDKYECWWGITALPCVNELEPSYLDYLLNEKYGAIIKWMKLGIAGFRLDVADELPDEFIKILKDAILKVNKEAILLGEVWEDASNKVSYDRKRTYILEESLDSVSNYPLRDSIIDLLTNKISNSVFSNKIMKLQENYPKNIFASLMNMTGTHDTTRLFSILGESPNPNSIDTWTQRNYRLADINRQLALKRLFLYYTVIYTLPGNPCIYYGDEICLEGYKDPYNRGTFDWDNKDTTIINHIKKLSLLRKQLHTADGFIRFIDHDSLLVFEIISTDNKYTVYINTNEFDCELDTKNIKSLQYSCFTKDLNNKIIISEYGFLISS